MRITKKEFTKLIQDKDNFVVEGVTHQSTGGFLSCDILLNGQKLSVALQTSSEHARNNTGDLDFRILEQMSKIRFWTRLAGKDCTFTLDGKDISKTVAKVSANLFVGMP